MHFLVYIDIPNRTCLWVLQIVMRYSSYQHVNRDRLFFEGLYITIINICDDALNALGRRSDIELFLGGLFRGRHFNLYVTLIWRETHPFSDVILLFVVSSCLHAGTHRFQAV